MIVVLLIRGWSLWVNDAARGSEMMYAGVAKKRREYMDYLGKEVV